MGIKHHSPSVLGTGVVLESSAIEACLLAKLSDSFPVVVVEQVELEDSLSYVGGTHNINFQ